jgi:transposase-like protein
MGIVLYSAGLSYTKVIAIIEMFLGRRFEDRITVWRDVQRVGEELRRRHFKVFKSGKSVRVGIDGGYFRVQGEKVCIMFAVDAKDSEMIYFDTKSEEEKVEIKEFVRELSKSMYLEGVITDDWENYKEEFERREIPHQVCLAHMKKNFKKQIRKLPDTVPKPFIETLTKLVEKPTPEGILILEEYVQNPYLYTGEEQMTQTRELFAQLYRKWQHYTQYYHDTNLPSTNNHTERAIGRSKFRGRTTKGFKSREGLLNFISVTQLFGEHNVKILQNFC